MACANIGWTRVDIDTYTTEHYHVVNQSTANMVKDNEPDVPDPGDPEWLTSHPAVVLYTSGPVSLKERLLYTLNKLFVKQVKSFLLLLDLDPFIPLSSPHNIKYIKFTSP